MIERLMHGAETQIDLDESLSAQEAREKLLEIPRTIVQFSDATKTARPRIYAAIEKIVSPTWRDEIPVEIFQYNQAFILSSELQEQILKDLQVPYVDEIPFLEREGWKRFDQIAHDAGVTKNNAFIIASRINPEWKSEALYIPLGQRRAFLISPKLSDDITDLAHLHASRQRLGVWRSLRARNVSAITLYDRGREQEHAIMGQFFSRFVEENGNSRFFNINNFHELTEQLNDTEIDINMRVYERGIHATRLLQYEDKLALTDEEKIWLSDYQRQGRRALSLLVLTNMPDVRDFARRYARPFQDTAPDAKHFQRDVENEAVRTLLQSVHQYSMEKIRSPSFDMYLFRRVFSAVRIFVANHDVNHDEGLSVLKPKKTSAS